MRERQKPGHEWRLSLPYGSQVGGIFAELARLRAQPTLQGTIEIHNLMGA